MRNRPSVTDWIQAAAVVLGVTLAIYELYLRDSVSQKDMRRAALQFIEKSGDAVVLQSVSDLVGLRRGVLDVEFWEAATRLTPYHQYLQSMAYCYDQNLCHRTTIEMFACDMVQSYEESVSEIYQRYDNEAARESLKTRRLQETEFWAACART